MLLWNRSRRLPARISGLTAFLDEGSEIEGKYTFSGVALLNGKFKGEIVSTDTLIIGEKGVVNATIRVGAVIISGEVVGGLLATERVEMKKAPRTASRRSRTALPPQAGMKRRISPPTMIPVNRMRWRGMRSER